MNEAADLCVILTPFKPPFTRYCDEILRPAIQGAGFRAVRADDLSGPGLVLEALYQLIREARVLVAVLTGQNANVFYELGLAHALGKPVVLVTDNADELPFDLRALRVILYDREGPSWGDELSLRLGYALKHVRADPQGSVSAVFRSKQADVQSTGSVLGQTSELASAVTQEERESEGGLFLPAFEARLRSLGSVEDAPSLFSAAARKGVNREQLEQCVVRVFGVDALKKLKRASASDHELGEGGLN